MKSEFRERTKNYGMARRHVLNEMCTREVARKCIKPGDVVIDLGANEGFHTRDFASLVGESGLVHAFEPNPALWNNLLQLSPVRLWPMAIGDVLSIETFYIPTNEGYHQVGSIVDPRDFMGPVPVKMLSVPQAPLDALREIVECPIKFAKIDVERRELQCLLGAKKLIARHCPVIVFENNTSEINSLLEAMNYTVLGMVLNVPAREFINVVTIPLSLSKNVESILLSGEEAEKILSHVEGLYPEDVI